MVTAIGIVSGWGMITPGHAQTFTEVGASLGMDVVGPGAAWGDYDNDGDLDLYVANRGGPNRLYRNNRVEGQSGGLTAGVTFTEVGASAGVNDIDGHGVGWGDYDNDGNLDLFVASFGEPNRLYRNNRVEGQPSELTAGVTFTDIAPDLGMAASGIFGSAASWGDYDNDGDLDLYVGNFEAPNLFYRNEGNTNRWVNITLRGTKSNRSAVGTVVTAVTGTKRQRRDVDGGSGFCSQPSLPVEFGFGQTTMMVDSLIIRWPSGIVQVLTNVARTNSSRSSRKGPPAGSPL